MFAGTRVMELTVTVRKRGQSNIWINKGDTHLVSWKYRQPYSLKWYIIRKQVLNKLSTADRIFAY